MPNINLQFPFEGKNELLAVAKQPPTTSPRLNNVRPQGTLDGRVRGGQRPGLVLRYSQVIGGASGYPCIELLQVTTVGS